MVFAVKEEEVGEPRRQAKVSPARHLQRLSLRAPVDDAFILLRIPNDAVPRSRFL
jgi:hypothetical protein